MRRNRATPDGHELGFHMARLCDNAEPQARLKMPALPPRCNSCAFRAGPHLANGSPETLMDAMKCVLERREFGCHEPHREGHPCSGWVMLMLADDNPNSMTAPWPWLQRPEMHESEDATPSDRITSPHGEDR